MEREPGAVGTSEGGVRGSQGRTKAKGMERGSEMMQGCGPLRVTAGIVTDVAVAELDGGMGDGGARAKAPKKGGWLSGCTSAVSSSTAAGRADRVRGRAYAFTRGALEDLAR